MYQKSNIPFVPHSRFSFILFFPLQFRGIYGLPPTCPPRPFPLEMRKGVHYIFFFFTARGFKAKLAADSRWLFWVVIVVIFGSCYCCFEEMLRNNERGNPLFGVVILMKQIIHFSAVRLGIRNPSSSTKEVHC